MPTTVTTFGADEISIRYKEDFFTEKANRKLVKILPRGLYTGFGLTTSGVVDTVTVEADSDGAHSAQYQGSDFDLTIFRTGGDFNISIPATGDLYYVVLVASYASGSTTSATIQLFTEAEWDALSAAQQAEYLVLGQVQSPSPSAIITAGAITLRFRTFPWDNRPEGARPWYLASRNGSFEDVDLAGTYDTRATGWAIDSNSTISVDFTGSDARTGSNSCELVVDTSATTVSEQFALTQSFGIPVVEGQRIHVRFYFRKLLATNSASARLDTSYLFTDSARSLSAISNGVALPIDGLAVSAGFDYVYETEIIVPAGSAYLESLSIGYDDLGSASTGTILRIDDVEVLVEPLLEYSDRQDISSGAVQTRFLHFNGVGFSSGVKIASILSGSSGLDITRRDGDVTSSDQPSITHAGTLELGAGLNHTSAFEQPRLNSEYADDPIGGIPAFGGSYSLQHEIRRDDLGSAPAIRMYAGGDGEIFWTYNAYHDASGGPEWTRDDNAQTSVLWAFNPVDDGKQQILYHDAAEPDTWTTWTSIRYELTDEGIYYYPENASSGQVGEVIQHPVGPYGNIFSFLGLHTAEQSSEAAIPQTVNFDFTAATDEIDVSPSVSAADLEDYIPNHFSIFKIITPEAHAGLYIVDEKDTSSSAVIRLEGLDGAGDTPVFPTVGSGTGSFLNSSYFGLFNTALDKVDSSGVGSPSNFLQAAAVFNAPVTEVTNSEGTAALALTVTDHGDSHFIRGFSSGGSGDTDIETFRIDYFGKLHSFGGISIYSSTGDIVFEAGSAEVLYGTTRTRTTQIMPWEGTPIRLQISTSEPWQSAQVSSSPTEGFALQSQQIFARWFCSLSERLPEGATVTEIRAYVEPGSAYGGGDEMELSWFEQTTDYDAGAVVPTFDGPNDATVDDGSTDPQVLEITGLNIVIDRPGSTGAPADTYAVQVIGGNGTGDRLYGIEIVWEDPGPRNY